MYCGYRTYMTSGDVMDTYGQYMKEEDLKKIDKSREAFVGFRDDTINSTMKYFHDDTYYQHYLTAPRTHGSYSDSTNFLQDWLVQHVE
jgi:hypothetical protein